MAEEYDIIGLMEEKDGFWLLVDASRYGKLYALARVHISLNRLIMQGLINEISDYCLTDQEREWFKENHDYLDSDYHYKNENVAPEGCTIRDLRMGLSFEEGYDRYTHEEFEQLDKNNRVYASSFGS